MADNIKINKESEYYIPNGREHVDASNDVPVNTNRYSEKENTTLPNGAGEYENEKGSLVTSEAPKLPRSLFSDYHAIKMVQMGGTNYPLFDSDTQANTHLYKHVTLRDLIANTDNRGAVLFKKEDFTCARRYGEIENNKLVVLRRFAYPVFDDISGSHQLEPDICRAVGFMGEEINNMKSLLSFTTGMNFKELISTIEKASMEGNQNGVDGYLGEVLKYVDPKYGKEAVAGANALNFNPYHDTNRVYGDVDVVERMNIRDKGIHFQHDVEIVIEFEAKSNDGINTRAATIDWLSNMVAMASVDATFWGGARYWQGVRPTKYMNMLRDKSPKDFGDFMKTSNVDLTKLVSGFKGGGSGESMVKVLKDVVGNALNLSLGKMLNTIGRPSIPMMNSLLTGTPMGTWHLSIGNPLNPVMSIGNLICEGVTIEPADDAEWSYDDFPNRWNAKFKLKHQQPRDRASIESMFNGGKSRVYFKPEDIMSKLASAPNINRDRTQTKDIWSVLNTYGNGVFGKYTPEHIERNIQSSELFKFINKKRE